MTARTGSNELITAEETSEMTQLSLDRLKQLRYERRIYPFYKVPGTRAVYYKRSEVQAIIDAGRIDVTS